MNERIKKLEANTAYLSRQNKHMKEAIKSAAGQLRNIPADASLQDVINALKSAAGQLQTIGDGDR